MDQEQVSFEIDPRSVVQALANMNKAVEGFEKSGTGANERLNSSFQRVSDLLLKMNDRSRNSMENLTRSIEKQAAAYGKTGVEKLISQRDAYIKRLGDEEGMIKRVTAAYDKMIAEESGGGGNKFRGFGEGIQNFMQNPLQAAQGAATGLLEKLGPMGSVAAAGAVGLAAIAAAGFEAAKSLGEYGVQVRDVQLRTGVSAKEAQQLAFAARAVGQDVSVTDRLMRGLTMAIEDDTAAGALARNALQGFGVDIRAVKDGTVPTMDVLRQVSTGLERMPSQWERNKAALDLFKRAGIEAIPFILELNKNLRESEGINFASDEQLKRFQQYQTEVAKIGTEWDQLALKVKEPLAATVLATIKWLSDSSPQPLDKGQLNSTSVYQRIQTFLLGQTLDHPFTAQLPPGTTDIVGDQLAALRKQTGLAPVESGPTAFDVYLQSSNDGGLEAQQAKLSELKKQYDKVRGTGRDQYLAEPNPANFARITKGIDDARIAYERQEAVVKSLTKAESERTQFLSQSAAFVQKGSEVELDAIGKIRFERDKLLDQASKLKGVESQVAGIYQSADQQASTALAKSNSDVQKTMFKASLDYGKEAETQWDQVYKKLDQHGKDVLANIKRMQADAAASAKADDSRQISRTGAAAQHMERMTAINGSGDELATLREQLSIRMAAANEELRIKQVHADLYDMDRERSDLEMKTLDARYQYEEKIAEIQQRQMDGLQREAEGLWHTLFTKPSEFGRELAGTIREAFLKPITEGLGNITANVLKPVVYGANGDGGIAGGFKSLFASQQSPIKISTDLNTTATFQNSAAMVALTGVLSAGLSLAAATPAPSPAISYPSAATSSVGVNASPSVPENQPFVPSLPSAPGPAVSSPNSLPIPPGGLTNAVERSLGLNVSPLAPSEPSVPSLPPAPGPVSSATSAVETGLGINVSPSAPESISFGVASSPTPSAPMPVGAASSFGLTSSPFRDLQNLVGGPGGTPGFAGRVGGSPGGGGILGSAGGFKGILASLGIGTGENAGNLAGSLPVGIGNDTAEEAAGIPGLGSIAPLSSPGQFSKIAGSPLATSLGLGLGISGVQRGGVLGTIEGTAGGALAGFGIGAEIGAIGGPLGMAIGAGVGLAASLISTFLFEPPWKEAQRLIKQLYRVDISKQMGQQIADLAKQKYAGQVSIAVRDPDVRKMIELYAAGTGQQMPLSASTPRGASLAESGGKLYQQAGYQYGQAYVLPSQLPVMGANSPGQWPGPLTPAAQAAAPALHIASLSLTVGDKGAADFMTGQVVTPDFVQSQWQSAANSSNGRTANSAMIQQPGLILS